MREAIAKSCDVYFYALGATLGIDRIHDFLAPFGYGAKTGIDIAGEEAGLLPSREQKRRKYRNARDPSEGVWYPGDSVNVAVGQGDLLVTPIQQAHIAAVLASRGTVFQPRLVTALRDPATGKTMPIAPIELPHVKGGTPRSGKSSWKACARR